MTRGKYIVIEGLDGSGKTTQFERLAQHMSGAVAVREPGGTDMAERIRGLIKAVDVQRAASTNAFLFSAARADLIERVIRPAVLTGKTVISDRNWLSTMAYQTADGAAADDLLHLCKLAAAEFFTPDMTLFIDIPAVTAIRRLAGRDGQADYFEQKGQGYFETVRRRYQQYLQLLPNAVTIVGDQPKDKVAADIQQALTELQLPLHRQGKA